LFLSEAISIFGLQVPYCFYPSCRIKLTGSLTAIVDNYY